MAQGLKGITLKNRGETKKALLKHFHSRFPGEPKLIPVDSEEVRYLACRAGCASCTQKNLSRYFDFDWRFVCGIGASDAAKEAREALRFLANQKVHSLKWREQHSCTLLFFFFFFFLMYMSIFQRQHRYASGEGGVPAHHGRVRDAAGERLFARHEPLRQSARPPTGPRRLPAPAGAPPPLS